MQGPLAPAVSLPHHIFYFKRRSSSGTYHQSDFSLAATLLLLILLLLYWLVLASSPEWHHLYVKSNLEIWCPALTQTTYKRDESQGYCWAEEIHNKQFWPFLLFRLGDVMKLNVAQPDLVNLLQHRKNRGEVGAAVEKWKLHLLCVIVPPHPTRLPNSFALPLTQWDASCVCPPPPAA